MITDEQLLTLNKSTQVVFSAASHMNAGTLADSDLALKGNLWLTGLLVGIGLQRFSPEVAAVIEKELTEMLREHGANLDGVPVAIRGIIEG